MTWSQFFLWLAIGYLIYYLILFVYDLFIKNKRVSDDDDVELVHNENIVAKDVESIEPITANNFNGKPIGRANNEIVIADHSQEEEEKEPDTVEIIEPFNETSSTGGILVKELFTMHKEDASQLANSIMF